MGAASCTNGCCLSHEKEVVGESDLPKPVSAALGAPMEPVAKGALFKEVNANRAEPKDQEEPASRPPEETSREKPPGHEASTVDWNNGAELAVSKSYTVRLRREPSAGYGLGLAYSVRRNVVLVKYVDAASPADLWNKSNADKRLEEGCTISQVNGIAEATAIIETVRAAMEIECTVYHPQVRDTPS
mmetsp:Transcript_36463/g.66808  ORF Transcript_36463/g.66808 Transcript_36463/m.66808 type:complete len:187 (-) Transcript_36463:101-661(-)